jgi:hypothetical protein
MIRIASWNAKGLTTSLKRESLFQWMKENQIHLCVVSEVWKLFPDDLLASDRKIGGYRIISRKHKSGYKGVAIVIDPRYEIEVIEELSNHSDHSGSLAIKLLASDITIISAYIPYGNRQNGIRELLDQLDQALVQTDRVILLGDLNAKLPQHSRMATPNAAGQCLHRYLQSSDNPIQRIRPTADNDDIPTYPAGNSILDHGLISEKISSQVLSFEVSSGLESESDHRPLLLNLRADPPPRSVIRSIRWNALRKALEKRLEPWDDSKSLPAQFDAFVHLIKELELKYSKEKAINEPSSHRIYFDEELTRLYRRRHQSREAFKQYRKCLRRKKREHWALFCSDCSKSAWRRLKVVREQRAPPIAKSKLRDASISLEASFD